MKADKLKNWEYENYRCNIDFQILNEEIYFIFQEITLIKRIHEVNFLLLFWIYKYDEKTKKIVPFIKIFNDLIPYHHNAPCPLLYIRLILTLKGVYHYFKSLYVDENNKEDVIHKCDKNHILEYTTTPHNGCDGFCCNVCGN